MVVGGGGVVVGRVLQRMTPRSLAGGSHTDEVEEVVRQGEGGEVLEEGGHGGDFLEDWSRGEASGGGDRRVGTDPPALPPTPSTY